MSRSVWLSTLDVASSRHKDRRVFQQCALRSRRAVFRRRSISRHARQTTVFKPSGQPVHKFERVRRIQRVAQFFNRSPQDRRAADCRGIEPLKRKLSCVTIPTALRNALRRESRSGFPSIRISSPDDRIRKSASACSTSVDFPRACLAHESHRFTPGGAWSVMSRSTGIASSYGKADFLKTHIAGDLHGFIVCDAARLDFFHRESRIRARPPPGPDWMS